MRTRAAATGFGAPPRPLRPPALAALALAALASACGESAPTERWISLAEGFTPATRISPRDPWVPPFAGGEPLVLAPEAEGTGAWITIEIAEKDWEPAPIGVSVWRARRPIWEVGLPANADLAPQRLESDERAFDYVPFSPKILERELPAGSFTGVIEFVYLKTGGERPPAARYTVFVERGASVDGRWRVGLERFTCDGFPLWSGHSETVTADVPAGSALRFASAGTATPLRLGEPAGEVTFRVLVDGEEVFRHRQEVSEFVRAERHRVVLPPEARRGARLTFSVEGPAAICAVLDPVLGPADPPATERPNVLLFLADTFRADNMRVYGERFEKSLTPNLDRFAEEGATFLRTWAPASWTLPSQASMMSGLHPHQHGADRAKRGIADGVETLAETFARVGFRTGAVTDSLMVSHRFGFDQGFQWFDESERELGQTLDEVRAFLDADDGRPFFLFVQTYRTHTPYYASEETRREYAQELHIDGDWDRLYLELKRAAAHRKPAEPIPAGVLEIVDRIGRLYRGGAVDLDRGFGELLADLDRRGLDANTWVVFTSDHGEAFGEHRTLFHGNGVWEELVRIPLAIRGPGLVPTRVETSASLVDLPRTLARLAGVPAAPRWGGRDLLADASDRPAFTFECPATDETGWAAVVDGAHKVLFEDTDEALAARSVSEAYDLSQDPSEAHDATEQGAGWPAQVLERHADELSDLRRALYRAPGARLRPKDIQDLAAVGYADPDADE